jgi:transposase
METKKLCCGIDVSHTSLDVCYQNNQGQLFHLKVGNNNIGFQKIMEHTGKHYHFVMEATGVYYIRLAFYLHSKGCLLSVVNAMAIKRYIQMHLERNKTDKKDAAWICKYAIEQKPPYWQMPVLTLRANNSIIPFANTPNRSSASITSCTACGYCPYPAKTP